MKSALTLLTVFFISISTFAQQGINYKALIKDDLGNVLANQEITIRFTIIEPLSSPTIRYQGTHNNLVTDANGIVTANIGNGLQSLSYGFFDDIEWEIHEHNLRVEIDITGGTNFVDFGTNEFKAVPYAKHAKTARTALNVSGLEQITEGGNTGWRLIGSDSNNYADIGENAIDLSYNDVSGFQAGATGDVSTAMGKYIIASGNYSTAMGNSTNASGDYATAMGFATEASGNYSTATGRGTESSGDYSTAMGEATIASGDHSTAMGITTTASGENALAIGRDTRAESFASVATGRYNVSGGSPTNWVNTDPLFEIGNGTNANRNNALTVLKNGKVGIGRHQPSSLLEVAHQNSPPTTSDYTNAFSIHNLVTGSSWQLSTVNAGHLSIYKNGSYRGFFNEASGVYSSISDRKAKKDITPLENGTLNKVMQLNPVSYLMKNQTDSKRNLGLISQEAQELFPSITHYVEESDLLALSYTELIPILIKALQEQQNIIEVQNSKIENMSKDLTALRSLEARMNQIETTLKASQL